MKPGYAYVCLFICIYEYMSNTVTVSMYFNIVKSFQDPSIAALGGPKKLIDAESRANHNYPPCPSILWVLCD